MFEGLPSWPDFGRFWSIVERYKVTKFYTAPTVIRMLIGAGDEHVKKYNRSSLKVSIILMQNHPPIPNCFPAAV